MVVGRVRGSAIERALGMLSVQKKLSTTWDRGGEGSREGRG